MMNEHEQLISNFYTAFAKKDYTTMQACYHPEATFSDPAFPDLTAQEVRAMWEMLIKSGADLSLTFTDIVSVGNKGKCHWEAYYTFSATGRKVHNVIDAEFEFRDGKIYRHRDYFNFWRWSRQALGLPGSLLGWTPFLKSKVQATARKRLNSFLKKQQ